MAAVPATTTVRTPLLLLAVLFGAVAGFLASQALWSLAVLEVVLAVAVLAGVVWLSGRRSRELQCSAAGKFSRSS